jgi:predicted transposase YbfD/YdcC
VSLKKLQARKMAIEAKLVELRTKARARLAADDRQYICCKSCKSKLNRVLTLKQSELNCQVCGETFMRKGEHKTWSRLEGQLKELIDSIKAKTQAGAQS